MKTIKLLIPFLFTSTILIQGQSLKPEKYKPVLQTLHNLQKRIPEKEMTGSDLVIGLNDPNEIVTITGSYYLDGDIYIHNKAKLIIYASNFKLDGDIYLLDSGAMIIEKSDFTIIQAYNYEHEALALENGELRFSYVKFKSSGESWGIGLGGSSHYTMEHSEVSDGFITIGICGSARATLEDTKTPGEFLCFNDNAISFTNCDFLLFWFVLPDKSVVETTLPSDSLLRNFNFSSAQDDIAGIPYTVSMDSCTGVMWGLISQTGSEACFHDTDFRAVGLFFSGPDSIAVSNITNISTHVNDLIKAPDRTLRLQNCSVDTWNFYTTQKAKLKISNSVFGEALSQDSSYLEIKNSVCDGTGGYLAAFDNSFMLVTESFIRSQVVSRNTSTMVLAETGINGPLISDESSIMLLINTLKTSEPMAYSKSILFDLCLTEQYGSTNTVLPLVGSARLLSGPEREIEMLGYEIKFSGPHESVWNATDGMHKDAVKSDLLAYWNTAGLESGNYGLKMLFYHSLGDPIIMTSRARLDASVDVRPDAETRPEKFSLAQNYPNPFNNSTTISFTVPEPANVKITLINGNGQVVKSVFNEQLAQGSYKIALKCDELPSGIYYYMLEANKFKAVKKLILLK